jgi:hypothetical protein
MMSVLFALGSGFAIGVVFSASRKRQSSPEVSKGPSNRGFLAVVAAEDADNLLQRASKIRKFLNQSSQVWKLNRRTSGDDYNLLEDLSYVPIDNPLVIDLRLPGIEGRVHELSRRLAVLSRKSPEEFNPDEEALDILVVANVVGFNGFVASLGETYRSEVRLCGTIKQCIKNLKVFIHRVGAELMQLAMARTDNMTQFVEAISPMRDVTAQPTQAFLHGGVEEWAVHTLDKTGDMWNRFFTEVMPSASVPMHLSTIWACFHAFGHAALVASALRNNSSLRAEWTTVHPTWDGAWRTIPEAVFLEADSICADGPTEFAIYNCATGVIHHVIEHMPVANESTYNWAYPCDKASSFLTAAACFSFVMGTVQVDMHGTWRHRKVLTQPHAWSALCLGLSHEHVVRGCLFGLSRTMFLLFENGVAEASLGVAGESSVYYSDVMSTQEEICNEYMVGNKVLCAMVSREQPHATSSGQALVQWCSRFVANSSGDFTDRDLLRFYTCMEGSQWGNTFSNNVDLTNHCDQLMGIDWQANATVRSAAHSLCTRTVMLSARRPAVPWPDLKTPSEELGLQLESRN